MIRQSNFLRLLDYGHRYLTYALWALSAVSALFALVPFYGLRGRNSELQTESQNWAIG